MTASQSVPPFDLPGEIRRQAEQWLGLLRSVFRHADPAAASWIAAEAGRLLLAFREICARGMTGCGTRTDGPASAIRLANALVKCAERSDLPGAVCAVQQALRRVAVESESAGSPGPQLDQLLSHITALAIQSAFEPQTEHAAGLETFNRALAHEIRNPLGAAASASYVLQDHSVSADPEQRRRFLNIIQRSIDRASDLVDDLSTVLSRYGSAPTEPRRRALATVIKDARFEVAPAAHQAGIALDAANADSDVLVDASRVSLVLANLLWNAIKYSDPRKPERWVRVGVQAAGDGLWHCAVADNGLGIPEADQPRIFDRFHRAHADTAPGSGLGLAICREAVSQMGGRIWFESVPLEGSTFSFTFPAMQMSISRNEPIDSYRRASGA